MKTKKSDKVVVQPEPVAAKPLSKTSSVKASQPVVKAPKPAVKAAVAEKASPEPVDVAKAEKSVKAKAAKKPKVVRDSFTMPQSEYQKITEIKELCLKVGVQVKKSEVLRAGVIALSAMSEAELIFALSALDKIKTGRPNKH
ncbi:MAG: hypothetical protein PHP85_08230 [Gallionella sp.]|nr:hypothetical protein [Gallionella sp.]